MSELLLHFPGHFLGDQEFLIKKIFCKRANLVWLDFFLFSFAIEWIFAQSIFTLFDFFPSTHNFFRNWSHSYCVQPASILNPKREINSYTYYSIWSNGQMMSKGVCFYVGVQGQNEVKAGSMKTEYS